MTQLRPSRKCDAAVALLTFLRYGDGAHEQGLIWVGGQFGMRTQPRSEASG